MYGLELALAKYDRTMTICKHIAESINLTAKYVWTGTCISQERSNSAD